LFFNLGKAEIHGDRYEEELTPPHPENFQCMMPIPNLIKINNFGDEAFMKYRPRHSSGG
jgi:hypothetical protein